ncbi:unnamed protein product [Closterium sp. NIES-54]
MQDNMRGGDSTVRRYQREQPELLPRIRVPSAPRAFSLLLSIHPLTQGNVEAAIAQYDAISASDPSDFRPYLCKGLVFSLMGDSKQADAHFKEFRRRCPKNYASYLDNMLVKSTVEARRQEREKRQQVEAEAKGQTVRPMKQPTSGAGFMG